MCMECGPLIKAIDAYIQKADDGLADALGAEGYIKPKKALKYAQDIEDSVAEALLEEISLRRRKRPLTSKPLRRTSGRG